MSVQFNALCQESRLYLAWNMVKTRGSAGGIDGVTIADFDRERHKQIQILANELKSGIWKPLPYIEVEIAKTKDAEEFRKIGMMAVRDKIVQHAIKSIIEPRYERLFLNNSYGYRPNKGAVKAIRRVLAECCKSQYRCALRLDIDNFFDSIDHGILQKRLIATGTDNEIVRLIMLCVRMGRIKHDSREWMNPDLGTPQGAVLSPLLSNLYLHSFDQFAVSRNVPYIRYADDFLFLCESTVQARDILAKTEHYLKEKLSLSLNQPPAIIDIKDGFDFLGITVRNKTAVITESKRMKLCERINTFELDLSGLSVKSEKAWSGMRNYYGKLLPQEELEYFDSVFVKRIKSLLSATSHLFGSKTSLQNALAAIDFISIGFQRDKKQHISDIVSEYMMLKSKGKQVSNEKKNRKLIQERKREFRKKEAETSGLLVNKPGTFIGLTNRGITVSQKGKVVAHYHSENLSQIVITGQGVSLSSNLMNFCMSRKIPIDFFDNNGTHLGSVVNSRFIQNTQWAKQANAGERQKYTIALSIIEGKIKNQHALVKYFNKYHKSHYPRLEPKFERLEQVVDEFKRWKKTIKTFDVHFMQNLLGHESQVAIRYWDYIRELFADDKVNFENREHRGATDLVNSMLNYGYAILSVRVCQALLAAQLNPYESIIHAHRDGKPTLVYDVMEIFRSQVVDRVVISLIQKGQELEVRNGLLTDKTRQLLVKAVMERLARYEKFRGEEMKMEQIILRQAKLLAKAFDGTENFKPYVAKW